MSWRAVVLGALVALAVAVAGSGRTEAMCLPFEAQLDVWPPSGAAIAARQPIVLSAGRAPGERLPDEMVAEIVSRELVLVDERGRRVALERVRVIEAAEKVQALVRPVAPLVVGRTYRIELSGETYRWKVAAAGAGRKLRWAAAAKVVRRSYWGGCPASALLSFDAPLEPSADGVVVEIHATRAGEDVWDFAPVRDGRVSLGWSSCQGGVRLVEGEAYRFAMVAIGPNGRRVPMDGAIEALGPSEADMGVEGKRSGRVRPWRPARPGEAGEVVAAAVAPAAAAAPAAAPARVPVRWTYAVLLIGMGLGTAASGLLWRQRRA